MFPSQQSRNVIDYQLYEQHVTKRIKFPSFASLVPPPPPSPSSIPEWCERGRTPVNKIRGYVAVSDIRRGQWQRRFFQPGLLVLLEFEQHLASGVSNNNGSSGGGGVAGNDDDDDDDDE